jgi:hypothetical protein
MSLFPGAAVWLALAVVLCVLVGVTSLGRGPMASLADVLHWWLESWLGRLLMLVMWAVAGYHVFTQRP